MQYTTNFSLKKPQYADEADIEIINDNSDDIDTLIHQNRTMIAPAFDSTKAYVVGDPVCYLGELFVFIADKAAGAWDASKVRPTTAAEMGGGGASALADLDDVEITNPSRGQVLSLDDDDKWKNQDLPDVSVTKTATGNPIEITDAAAAPLVKCVSQITGYQSGTGTPSPDNIRPIVAYTEGEIEVRGRNMWNPSDVTDGYYINESGNLSADANFMSSGYIDISPEVDYVFSICRSGIIRGQGMRIAWYDENNTFIRRDGIFESEAEGIRYCSYKSPSNAKYARASSIKPPYSYNNCFELGTVPSTPYEPYTSTTHTTTYPSAIYRGSEDCVNGTATTEWGMIASYAGETLPGEWISDRDEYAPGTTPTTGAQVAYELATPTTTSVTPTNLPIKTLNGYNHIESSTGEMEIEYIRNTYQPIVDLIQSSSHVYSTAEQIVGKWIDGKDLFEKTIVIQNFSASTADSGWYYGTVDLSDYGINPERLFPQQGETYIVLQDTTPRIPIYIDWQGGTNLYLYFLGSRSGTLTVVVRYTKVTVSRSLNTSLNTQKAQIEPLSEKEEEIPVEEEKAVEMPETEEPENER